MTKIERQILQNQLILLEIADAQIVEKLGHPVYWGSFRQELADYYEQTCSLLNWKSSRRTSDEAVTHTIAVSEPRKIEELELFARTSNALKNAGIQTVEDLAKRSPAELLRIPNFGRLALNDVRQRLNENGVTWP